MARQNAEAAIERILGHEGGYTADRRDPGNWTGGKVGVGQLKGTNFGVAAASFPQLDIKNLTIADAVRIFKKKYWDAVRGDDLPSGVDYSVGDFAVNSGVSRSSRYLQSIVGVPVDGIIGNQTVGATWKYDPVETIKKLCAKRLGFVKGLAIFSTYGRGWVRRITEVEALSVRWALRDRGMEEPSIRRELERQAGEADKKTKQNGSAAGGSAVGAGGSGTATDPSAMDANILVWLIIAAFVVGVAFFGWKAWVHYNRKKAYEKLNRETTDV